MSTHELSSVFISATALEPCPPFMALVNMTLHNVKNLEKYKNSKNQITLELSDRAHVKSIISSSHT